MPLDDPDRPLDPSFDDFDPEDHVPIPDPVDLVVEVASMISVFAAQRLRRVEALRRDAVADAQTQGFTATDVVERGVRLELAAALRVTEHVAGGLMARAYALVREFPQVLELLDRARTTEQHVEHFVDAMREVEPEHRPAVVERALPLMEAEAVGTFRRSLRRLIDTVRSRTLEARHREALTRRRVAIETVDDGMAWLTAYLPAVEAHAIHSRLTGMAKAIAARESRGATPEDADVRTLDQIRADVLGDLLIDGDTAVLPDVARGVRATVAVTVPVLTLLGEDDSAARAPATVEGLGPIPLSRARELCGGDGRWMRVLTHPETGAVLSVGRDHYSPPADMRRLVKWRADRCMAPGCGVPASRCEIDHTIDWQHGGETAITNLAPLCKGHHTVKHHSAWAVEHDGGGGALRWTSPSGRQYVVPPRRVVPVFRPSAGPAPF